ncbi:MAG: hypothetical protein KGI67_04060 [Pseudomonadota bacterium]|nr:hypothetical protein [Pseudomonadota bacterium]
MRRGPPTPGVALVAALALLGALSLLLLAHWNVDTAVRAERRALLRQTALEQQLADRLQDWYRQHLAELDAPGAAAPDPATVLQTLPGTDRIRVALGPLTFEGDVAGRLVYAATGSDSRVLVDGHALERLAIDRARRQLRQLAARLETWFAARIASDPLHLADSNHFRPADPGCFAASGELPCLAEYVDVAQLERLANALALTPSELHSPWGSCCPLEASNGADASAVAPYTLALRVRTPWDLTLVARAVQPAGGT